ncbi:homocysteine S-methyltransferase family protein [Vibrio sp. TH_r3]|uniref:homocysteine S-methyltransferase family protein n=1 Tax=Vibrio sp. TH_r3 TaxID=3082084 RepID=UPI002953E953|nr:homocysteine S-methyltransferase family protein [Vibrio sp. TH_r3]MDV7103732.1 homocysteine S-methyltransferase family protein [Vibrio sp. TH_r3]
MNKITILDGGMGRELKAIGAPFSQPLWSAQALIESPAHVTQVHQSFIDSGAEIIIANSYACVPFHLGEARFKTEGAHLARKAAKIAQSVAQNTSVQVAGAIPPPFGSYRPDLFDAEEAVKIVNTLIEAQDPYVDLWLVETICSIEEFDVIYQALNSNSKDCYYSFSLDDSHTKQANLRSGQSVQSAIEKVVKQNNVKGILFNCSVPEVMEQAVEVSKITIQKAKIDMQIGVYANNFMPILTNHKANGTMQPMRELSPQQYLVYVERWYKAGATIIGGCCGIGPSHIKAIAEWKARHQL